MWIRHRSVTLCALGAITLSLFSAPAHAAPSACDPAATRLLVTFQPVDHTVTDAQYFRAELTIANNDPRCSLGADWAMSFNSVRQPVAVYPAGDPGDGARRRLADQGLTVARADKAASGDFFRLAPTSSFKPIGPGQRRVVTMDFEFWAMAKTDAPAGWSIRYGDGAPHWVPAKAVQDPTDPKQTKAFSGDARPEQSAATRYADNASASKVDLSLKQRILPQPYAADATGGNLRLDADHLRVAAPASLRGEASYLRSALGDALGGISGGGTTIRLAIDPRLTVDGTKAEAYALTTTGSGVTITGADAAGVLHGIQTLRQLIPAATYKAAASGHPVGHADVPKATISDAPQFTYRGMQLDVTRHFQSKQTVEKFLDLLSYLKLNALHLRLGDDEGWRLAIPGLPELTGFGSHRGYDLTESRQLHQAMGSGSDLGAGDGIQGKAANPTAANLGRKPAYQGYENATVNFVGQGSGAYSTKDFEEILKYADQRHIQVVPEFDFPAHARAAVQSMERRYQRTHDSTYRLLDPADTSKHVSVQYYTDNLANPCVPGTYNFLTKVTREVKKMYDAAGVKLGMFNMGGDEAPNLTDADGRTAWQGSPACKNNAATTGKSNRELWDYFWTRFNAIAGDVAPNTAGWEDVALDGTGSSSLPRFVALPWQNVWGWGREQVAYQMANAGKPVILAHATNLYMDLAYNKDVNEPGYYWANYVDEKSTFTYQPYDVYANATEDRWGNPFTPDPSWTKLTDAGKKNILGMEAQLFGENGKAPEIREYQAFPKLLGVAERAWNRRTPAPSGMPAAFNVFNNTLGQVTFPLLSYYRPVGLSGVGVNYRIPLPGGQISGGTLTANVRDVGMAMEYSTDGVRWSPYTGPAHVGSTALLRTRAADGRVSRISPVGLPRWSGTAAYPSGSLVNHRGEIYRATKASPAGTAPDTAPGTWTLIE